MDFDVWLNEQMLAIVLFEQVTKRFQAFFSKATGLR